MLGDWDCACGRRNGISRSWCFLCGDPRPVEAGIPDESRAVVEDILREGSERLSRRYDLPVRITCHGGMDRLTPEGARELGAETADG